MSATQDAVGGLQPLSPHAFRAQLMNKHRSLDHPENNTDTSAYEAFLNNCRALSLTANTALLQEVDGIRNGSVVDLSRTYVGGAGLQAMCTLLAQNHALRTLRLPQNGLYNDAVVYFCRSMKHHPNLSTIDFSGNPQVSLAGGLALLSLVNDNSPTLAEVDLTGTRIPDAVLLKIKRAVASNQESLMLLSSDGSRNTSPVPPPSAAVAATMPSEKMAKTMAARYQPPKAAATADGRRTHGGEAARLPQTYTANRAGVFATEHGANSNSAGVWSSADTTTTTTTSTYTDTQRGDASSSATMGAARIRQSTSHVHHDADAFPLPLTTQQGDGGGTVVATTNTVAGTMAARTRAERETARATTWAAKETAALQRLHARLDAHAALLRANNATNTLPPADPVTRWRLLEVAVLAPPAIFDSEIEVLLTDVFPTLNKILQPYRVMVYPLVNPTAAMSSTSTSSASTTATTAGAAGEALKTLRCICGTDVLHDVQRSRVALIELIGDRPGDLRQPTEADMEAGATEMVPVLYTAHQEALACSHGIIPAIRREATCMGIPPALAPLFTCEPRIEHPDKHRPVAKTLRLDGTEAMSTSTTGTRQTGASMDASNPANRPVIVLDHAREMRLWERHEAFKNHVRHSLRASPEMIIDGYKATFGGVDSTGAVRVVDLDEFRNAVYHRLFLLLTTLFTPVTTASLLSVADLGVTDPHVLGGAGDATSPASSSAAGEASASVVSPTPVLPERDLFTGPAAHQRHLTLRAYQTVSDRLFSRIVEASPRTLPSKSVLNRLHLYLTTPPSRNVFLLHHPHESTTLTSTLAVSATRQLFAKPFTYSVATHSTRVGVLSEEPTEVREVMVHILSQLTTNPEVLRYLRCEVDIERLKRFFINFLSGSQIRPVESEPAMVALASLGTGATAVTSTTASKAGPTATTATAGATTLAMPDITAKSLQQTAKEAAEAERTGPNAARSAASEDANRVFVVLLDGLDAVVTPAMPCAALRRSPETGVDEWATTSATSAAAATEDTTTAVTNPTTTTFMDGGGATRTDPQSGKVKHAQLVAEETQRLSFLPTCLSRNVRLIATCTTTATPQLLKVLTDRGRDSVDAFAITGTTVNTTEMLLSPSALEPFGTALSDDGLVLARNKADSQNPEFLHYLTDALRMHTEAPGSQSLLALLAAFPETVDGAARRVHQQLVARFGPLFVKNALGLLSASRWGLVESDLRALLQLPPRRFNEFLRVLRPALDSLEWFGVPPIPAMRATGGGGGECDAAAEGGDHDGEGSSIDGDAAALGKTSDGRAVPAAAASPTTLLDPNCTGNVLQRRLRLISPAFRHLLRQEELHADEDGRASAAEQRTWHQTLAQYYYAVVQRSLSQERHQLILSTAPASAAERQAVKELVYHAALGGLWALLDRVALSFPFMMLVYRHQLGYAYLRDLVFAFNTRHEDFLLGVEVSATSAPPRVEEEETDLPTSPFAGGERMSTAATTATTTVAGTGRRAVSTAASTAESMLPTALLRMRSYIFFVRAYSAMMTEHPHLVLQAALERSPGLIPGADMAGSGHHEGSRPSPLRMVQYEAADYIRRYFYWQPSARAVTTVSAPRASLPCVPALAATTLTQPEAALALTDAQVRHQSRTRVFFRIANERRSRVHLGAVPACAFSPNGKYLVTGSNDRAVAWVVPSSGAVVYQGRQSSARVRQVIFADTSAYVMSVAEDRTLYIYDAALGKLVSRNDGALFDAPISAIQFSARGRYYIVVLEDFTTHVFSTERSLLIGSVPAASWHAQNHDKDAEAEDGDDDEDEETAASAAAAAAAAAARETAHALPSHRRAHMHVLPDPADEKRFHLFANELVQTWAVKALADGVECVAGPRPTAFNTPLASVHWYPRHASHTHPTQAPSLREMRQTEHDAAKKILSATGRFALVLPLHRGFVSVYDLETQCEITRVCPASLNGQCWCAAPSSAQVVAFAAGPAHGRWLAVAGADGGIALYDLFACITPVRVTRQLASATANALPPVEAPVHTCFSAYRASAASPRILGLAFALDDTALVAVSDTNRVLYWDVESLAAEKATAAPPLLANVGAEGHRPPPVDGADGEFLLSSVSDSQLVSWALRTSLPPLTESPSTSTTTAAAAAATETSRAGAAEGAALIALGDSEGRVILLDLWRPTA